jgi:hypothetical protein
MTDVVRYRSPLMEMKAPANQLGIDAGDTLKRWEQCEQVEVVASLSGCSKADPCLIARGLHRPGHTGLRMVYEPLVEHLESPSSVVRAST